MFNGKTEEDIKAWIDSKEVFTFNELYDFIYGYYNINYIVRQRINNIFLPYILQTKNAQKMRLYKEQKINKGRTRSDKKLIQEIILKDKRLHCGSKSGPKLLKSIYNITLSPTTFKTYKREVIC